ncbi:P-loop containing nucleoside triphosphate hydrolase protein [Kickxella alabastrina]|uniref:P-loop containing nucleoside triphosphate hydrolase protein n=1 Tax=Kickxella alabastrina TaxID=61397 RepID=UPI00221F7EF5|nr:P-loop containing nucleoside triphosphate hydrolase protein [Kickxella alabastrina]KAI7833569.1 P-loop containing nucleoside triphosphate hydrolase protein [Kickxella alabastrina]
MSALKGILNLTRTQFTNEKTINWFPGHMAKGIKQMQDQMRTVDLIVETRDARIPLSSINSQFEKIICGKPRLVVYNKADLAPLNIQNIVSREMAKRNQRAIFTDTTVNNTVRQILNAATDIARSDPVKYPQFSVMVVGMPNVGKSSLINALRRVGINKGKAASTGAKPGVTRAMSSKIKVLESPVVYLLDTPGVMMPHIPDPLTAIKVALSGGIKDNIADESVLADYLLFRLNRMDHLDYCAVLGIDEPTDDVNTLVEQLAKKIGALRHGGEIDVDKTLHYFLRTYRQGLFGRLCLDDLDEKSIANHFKANLEEPPLSKNQGKKAKRAAQRQRSLDKARSKNLI